MKILVTGTAGFIGFHLANRLIERGDEVFGLDVINDYYDVNVKYDRLAIAGISRASIAYGQPVKSTKFANYTFIKGELEDQEPFNHLTE